MSSTASLSSWAVHDWVSDTFPCGPGVPSATGTLDRILDLPARAAEAGIYSLEVCNFHLVQAPEQLNRLSVASKEAGVTLFQLLIDQGDLAHPTDSESSFEFIQSWIEAAAVAGFKRVRVIAGQQPANPETIHRSVKGLRRLKTVADRLGVGISTENWHQLMATPETVKQVLEESGVGLVFDFGNWNGPDKLARLGQIVSFATSCHAKCDFVNGEPDLADFHAVLEMVKASGFEGALSLVHPEPPDEWAALTPQLEAIKPYCS